MPLRLQTTQQPLPTNFSRAHHEHKRLLFNVKTTVKSLILANRTLSPPPPPPPPPHQASSTVCNDSPDVVQFNQEGLLRLHSTVEQIFLNGIRIFKPDHTPDCWSFIEGLNWLNPSMTNSIANMHHRNKRMNIYQQEYPPIPVSRIKNDKALCWIYENLESHKLSNRLKYLLSDTEHLNKCYEVWSFLQNEKFSNAFLLCLRAIENNQPNLLSQIDQSLLSCCSTEQDDGSDDISGGSNGLNVTKSHRRSTSHPDFSYVPVNLNSSVINNGTIRKKDNFIGKTTQIISPRSTIAMNGNLVAAAATADLSNLTCKNNSLTTPQKKKSRRTSRLEKRNDLLSIKLRGWGSLPDIHKCGQHTRARSKTVSQAIHIPYQKVRLTAEAIAFNDLGINSVQSRSIGNQQNGQKVPSFSYKPLPTMASNSYDSLIISSKQRTTMTSTAAAAAAAAAKATVDLQPISLVKCDDIKIHFDRKHTPKHNQQEQRESLEPPGPFISPLQLQLVASLPPSGGGAAAAAALPPRQTSSTNIDETSKTTGLRKISSQKLFSYLPMLQKVSSFSSSDGAIGGENNLKSDIDNKGTTITATTSLYNSFVIGASGSVDFVGNFLPKDGAKLQNRYGRNGQTNAGGGTINYRDNLSPSSIYSTSFESTSSLAALSSKQREQQQQQHQQQLLQQQKPLKTQSITSFLQSGRFSRRQHNDLERENAHFSLAEAMISAIEQIKWTKLEQISNRRGLLSPGGVGNELNVNGGDLLFGKNEKKKKHRWKNQRNDGAKQFGSIENFDNQSTKYRRSVKQTMSLNSSSSSSASSLELSNSDLESDISGSSVITKPRRRNYRRDDNLKYMQRLTVSAQSLTNNTNSELPHSSAKLTNYDNGGGLNSSSTSGNHQLNLKTNNNDFSSIDNDDNDDVDDDVDDHRAYAEWGDNILENLSAESVALSLISKFSDKQLPRACDLLWLVSEQDAPQQLLPMPGSWTINPDEAIKIPFTRGTRDWAPPREQIIFTRHPQMNRKGLLYKQNQRCAGCGMKVAAAYSHRFRYCDYLGKFHCTGCHRNQIAMIPARILDRWDFNLYSVSVFAYRLLDQISTFPLFHVTDLNKNLYKKIRPLQVARIKREDLKFIKDFIISCRFADETRRIFNDVANHITNDTDVWSMADFCAVREGTFIRDINALITKCEKHIFSCELCTARGFICEICKRDEIIYPWQTKIRRCMNCGTCVHQQCWQNECAKCLRLLKREKVNNIKKSNILASTSKTTPATTTTATKKARKQ